MNPLTKDSIDIDIELLEQIFEDDCKCESPSCKAGRIDCSFAVVALRTAHDFEHRVCQAIVNFQGLCSICDKWAQECWTIRPI